MSRQPNLTRTDNNGQAMKFKNDKQFADQWFVPIGDKVVLQLYQVDETEGGIVLPDQRYTVYEPIQGLVVAAGPDCKQVKRGDLICTLGDIQVKQFRYKGVEFIQTKEESLLGIMESAAAKETTEKGA